MHDSQSRQPAACAAHAPALRRDENEGKESRHAYVVCVGLAVARGLSDVAAETHAALWWRSTTRGDCAAANSHHVIGTVCMLPEVLLKA